MLFERQAAVPVPATPAVAPHAIEPSAEGLSSTERSIAALARAHIQARERARNATAPGETFSRRVALDLVSFFDVAVVVVSGLAAAALYGNLADVALNWFRVAQMCLVTALFTYYGLQYFKFYETRHIHNLPSSPLRIIAALVIAFCCLSGLGAPSGITQVHFWIWYGLWLAFAGPVLIVAHALLRRLFAVLTKSGTFDSRIAVYGAGTVATRISDALSDPSLGLRLEGVYDDRSQPRGGQPRLEITGGLDELVAAGRAGAIDQIIIALPQADDKRMLDIVHRLQQIPVSLHIYTHVASDGISALPMHSVSQIGRVGLLDVKPKPLTDWAPIVKTCEDYLIGGIALVLALPVMALIAIAIKIDSRGPVLFRQRRHGLNRRIIEVMKFRTMRVMEDGAGVKQASKDDPRVTRLGRLLRRTSLDELPQLFNVLSGEMSLVGPRPHALVHDDHYGAMLETYANRHQVKPGMTGWAQIHGFRGPTETSDKMQGRVDHDLVYIDAWSLWLDLKIMVLTVVHGFKHKNAL